MTTAKFCRMVSSSSSSSSAVTPPSRSSFGNMMSAQRSYSLAKVAESASAIGSPCARATCFPTRVATKRMASALISLAASWP
ncbi:hypothetical protein [Kutzneria chonburiensis]|uniref:hypothetical protein n=1 Tax=Kutzneria chonburiensis TaxID=1483604 RepID=UPI00236219D3|nr:hypothetical protein [Kutzneria chonburiensis]